MNKDNKNTFVTPEEVSDYLENGRNLGGRKLGSPSDSSRKGGLWINNGERQMRVLSDELQTYLDNGWVRGYCKKAKENLSSAHLGSK